MTSKNDNVVSAVLWAGGGGGRGGGEAGGRGEFAEQREKILSSFGILELSERAGARVLGSPMARPPARGEEVSTRLSVCNHDESPGPRRWEFRFRSQFWGELEAE